MTRDPQPEDSSGPRIRKLLEDYPEKISAIKAPPAAGTRSGGEQDPLAAISAKLESLDLSLNRDLKRGGDAFLKLEKKIESELAGVPGYRPPPRPVTPAGAGGPGGSPPVQAAPVPPEQPAAAPLPPPVARPAPQKAAGRRPALLTALAVLALAAAGAVLWRHFAPAAPAHRVFPLSYPQTAGLAVKGRSVLSADPQRQLLFTMSREDAQVAAVQKFPNRRLSGLAAGDGCLWSSDRERIYLHGPDEEHPVLRSFENPSRSPGALYWSDGLLWVGDYRSAMVSKYAAGEELVLVKQYALPGPAPAGIYVSGNLLWVLDPAANRITRYLLGPALSKADSLDLKPLLPSGSRATGFTADGPDLFLLTENPAELHRVDLAKLKTPAFLKEDW